MKSNAFRGAGGVKKTLNFPNGEKYYGEVDEDDMPNGHGTHTSEDGFNYTGRFVHGEMTGYGKMTMDGSTYEGNFKNGEFDGTGTFTYDDGRVYIGDWLNGNKTGNGKMTWKDGRTYEGAWLNNQINGRGKLTEPDGNFIEGLWRNGEPIIEEPESPAPPSCTGNKCLLLGGRLRKLKTIKRKIKRKKIGRAHV